MKYAVAIYTVANDEIDLQIISAKTEVKAVLKHRALRSESKLTKDLLRTSVILSRIKSAKKNYQVFKTLGYMVEVKKIKP